LAKDAGLSNKANDRSYKQNVFCHMISGYCLSEVGLVITVF
jgi:hypothetical protein